MLTDSFSCLNNSATGAALYGRNQIPIRKSIFSVEYTHPNLGDDLGAKGACCLQEKHSI